MNTVEDRLRDALRERAAHSPIDPDAWEQTVARVRRPVRARPWARFVIPVAAAAAVVAVIAGAAALTRLGDQHGSGRPASPAASAPAVPAPPGSGNYLIQQDPPVSAIVPVKMTADGQTSWTFVWFGYDKYAPSEGDVLCSVTDGGSFSGTGGCGLARLAAHQVAAYSAGAGGTGISEGVSQTQVTSVTARLPAARTVPGAMVSGRGFPYKVWVVMRPYAESAQIVFRNDGGHELGQLPITVVAFPARPSSGGIVVFRQPAGVAGSGLSSVTAYLVDGKVDFFPSGGNGIVLGNVPASGPPTVAVQTIKPLAPGASTTAEFYGYAHQNVTRVVLQLADGKQYSAQTFAAWPGSGLRLWAFPLPSSRAAPAQGVISAYNAAGQRVWRQPIAGA
jgi:hypothetical protein